VPLLCDAEKSPLSGQNDLNIGKVKQLKLKLMHSKIYQITEERIGEDNYITERTFDEGRNDFYDYCADIDEDDRNYAIESLAKNLLPTGMFTIVEKDTLIYNGGAEEWKDNWVKLIHQKAKAITPENITEWIGEAYTLEKELLNPLDIGSRFVTDTFPSNDAQQSGDFMKMICGLEPGAKLYIGGVVDFHW
jgi:hypothetical protein